MTDVTYTLTITVSHDEHECLSQIAQTTKLPIEQLVNEAVTDFLNYYDGDTEMQLKLADSVRETPAN